MANTTGLGYLNGKELYGVKKLNERKVNTNILEGGFWISDNLDKFVADINNNGLSNAWIGILRQIPYCVAKTNGKEKIYRIVYRNANDDSRRPIAIDGGSKMLFSVEASEVKYVWALEPDFNYLDHVELKHNRSILRFNYDLYRRAEYFCLSGAFADDILPEKKKVFEYFDVPVRGTLGIHGPGQAGFIHEYGIPVLGDMGESLAAINPSSTIIVNLDLLQP